jgi:hypothetical protein
MNLMPAVRKTWRRSRRALFHLAAVCACTALCTAVLAAVPARAAGGGVARAGLAASVPGGVGTAGAGAGAAKLAALTAAVPGLGGTAGAGAAKLAAGATTVTLPATTTASYDYPYPVNETNAAINDWLPEAVGLPAGAPLGQVLDAVQALWQQADPSGDWQNPEPNELSGATDTVTSDGGTGSILTVTAPTPSGADTPGPGGTVNPVLAGFLAHLTAFVVSAGTLVVLGAYLFGLPTNDSVWDPAFDNARPIVQKMVTTAATVLYEVTSFLIFLSMTSGLAPSTNIPWQGALGTILGASAAHFGDYYVPTLTKLLQYQWTSWAFWMGFTGKAPVTVLNWLLPYITTDQADQMMSFLSTAITTPELHWILGDQAAFAGLLGLWEPVAHGYVGSGVPGAAPGLPVTASGNCMDAYGSNGDNEPVSPPAVPNHPVAINVCNGNPSQVFNFWPSGQISVWGLCMDDENTNPMKTPPVDLQPCNGGSSQQWFENKNEIVNSATGNCLDDPGANTAPGTQLIVYPCNAKGNELWAPPGATPAVGGANMVGTNPPVVGAFSACFESQARVASPVGLNIITNRVGCGSWGHWMTTPNGGPFMVPSYLSSTREPVCMDSGGGKATTGPGGEATTFVTMQSCNGLKSQVWNLVKTSSGMTLQNMGNGLCINTKDGTLNAWVISMVTVACGSPPSVGELWSLQRTTFSVGSLSGGPCDIYAYYGTPCAAAYSMTRALYAGYDGPLYQVTRASDGTTKDIGLLAQGGHVDASQQDSFCGRARCTVTEVYDQSPDGNNLTVEQGGGTIHTADQGADAAALPVEAGGNKAYGLDIEQQTGYRDDGPGNAGATGVATGGAPEGMYMVASGTHVNQQCCFDFGNVETNDFGQSSVLNSDNGAGHMDAVNLTTWCGNNNPSPCGGPSVEADLENGQWTGGSGANVEPASGSDFVTAMLGNDGQSNFELQGGNSESGGLTTFYNGSLPGGYQPMDQEGGIVLGTGGDNSNSDVGSFFEGVMTAGYPSDAASAAVQANIVAAGYSGTTTPVATAAPSAAGQAVVHSAGATGQGASGFSSVYTVDSANGHLKESYLPYMGGSWVTQDLSGTGGTLPGTPPVMAGTQPVAITHCGYTSVYTVDASSGDLQETYLPAIGGSWVTQDLSGTGGLLPGTPPTDETPTAVVHSAGATGSAAACGFTSVYTVDRDGDLQETYLPVIGGSWVTQDLSGTGPTLPGTPPVQPGTSPVAITHCGFTSVYTVDGGSDHLQESYLPAIGGSWVTQDLSGNYGTPATDATPSAVVHTAGAAGASGDCGYTSVYTVDQASRHLDETFLPNAGFPGDAWQWQDLSAKYTAPQVAPGTAPVALVHLGFTSVFTVDQGSDHLQETYLPAIGGGWVTQDLSGTGGTLPGTPPTDQTPVVLLHPDASGVLDWASVFTVDEFSSDLQETYLSNAGFPGDAWVTQNLTAKYTAPQVAAQESASPATWSVAHDGYTSTYTVDASSGHLRESYLPALGGGWVTQDLSGTGGTLAGTPPVMAGTEPVALYHDGFTSVYTADASSGDLQETYLKALGGSWLTQDLSAGYQMPAVDHGTTPAAVFHDGYASVYYVSTSGHLQEAYLPAAGFPGDAWHTQPLPGAPAVMPGTSPVAIVHDGYTSVYYVAGNGDLWESYLPYMGDTWSAQDLSAQYDVPPTRVTPAAVFHDGFTSVYTVDENGNLEEAYLPYMGARWSAHDLTATYGVPQSLNIAPAALFHDGFTSVYYHTGPNDDLEEAFLPAISGPWQWQDLSALYITPASVEAPSPLVHYDFSGGRTWASVYTVDASTGDLQETYLPDAGFPGDAWVSQDLTAKYKTPPVAPPGGTVYAASSGSEYLGYNRAVSLGGGTMLSTFEHEEGNGSEGYYVIQKSTDSGATWSTLTTVDGGDVNVLAPFLFRYPTAIGGMPAGTLMLLGDTRNASNVNSAIREWISTNNGATWHSEGIVQSGGGIGDGVWEPFVTVTSSGLAMFFSDERQNATHSQFIGEILSTDGLTWSANPDGSISDAGTITFGAGEIPVVVSSDQADRPGMATVAEVTAPGAPHRYVMSYEVCGRFNCAVYLSVSQDGVNWGESTGLANTSSGLYLEVSPVITWVNNGGDGTLYLTARRDLSTFGATLPSGQTVILTNTSGGDGTWSWIPAPPIPTAGANTAVCSTNYSPYLIEAGNSTTSLLYITAEAAGPNNCEETAIPVPIAP